MPVSAQNVMQKGKVEDMVSLIKLSERLAEAKVKKALKYRSSLFASWESRRGREVFLDGTTLS